MTPQELIIKLKDDGYFSDWMAILSEGDKDYVTGSWYNLLIEKSGRY